MTQTRRASVATLAVVGIGVALVVAMVAAVRGGGREVATPPASPDAAVTLSGETTTDSDADTVSDADADADAAADADAGGSVVDVDADGDAALANERSEGTLEQLLAEQIAPESQHGTCAESYRLLQDGLGRLVTEQKARASSARAVEAAARTVIAALPRHVCRASASGTWALLYDELTGTLAGRSDSEHAETYPSLWVHATGRLVFLPADEARRLELRLALGAQDHASLLSLKTEDDGFSAQASTVSDLEIGDIDGDGVPEVLITRRRGVLPLLEGADTRKHVAAVYRVDSGSRIEDDPRVPADVAFDHLVDGDGDGRFDLVSPLPFFGLDEGNLSDIELQGPELLYHSLADGGFSRSDAPARAFARKSCPARPHELPAPSADSATLPVFLTDVADRAIHDVACARLWGVPTDTLAAWVTAVHGGKELTRWAALAPPLQLAP